MSLSDRTISNRLHAGELRARSLSLHRQAQAIETEAKTLADLADRYDDGERNVHVPDSRRAEGM